MPWTAAKTTKCYGGCVGIAQQLLYHAIAGQLLCGTESQRQCRVACRTRHDVSVGVAYHSSLNRTHTGGSVQATGMRAIKMN